MNAASTHPATGAVDIALFLAPRTVDAGATAVSGRTLGAAQQFTFTTPTVRLTSARWA